MIPDFNEHGYLPAGIHRATLEEVAQRFGHQSEPRRVQMESLRWLCDLARQAGLRRLIINGSFVTDTYEPNDVDCVLLIEPAPRKNVEAEEEMLRGLPFLEIHLVEQDDFDFLTGMTFSTDRRLVPKGMVEVLL